MLIQLQNLTLTVLLVNILSYLYSFFYSFSVFCHMSFKNFCCQSSILLCRPKSYYFCSDYTVVVLEGLAGAQKQREPLFLILFSCLLLSIWLVASCYQCPNVQSKNWPCPKTRVMSLSVDWCLHNELKTPENQLVDFCLLGSFFGGYGVVVSFFKCDYSLKQWERCHVFFADHNTGNEFLSYNLSIRFVVLFPKTYLDSSTELILGS